MLFVDYWFDILKNETVIILFGDTTRSCWIALHLNSIDSIDSIGLDDKELV